MKRISVGELRQNPTQMLEEVAAGETYSVTRHNREIARISPVTSSATIIPAKKRGPARTRLLAPVELPDSMSVDDLLDEMKGEW
ncbi:hypothetical protein GCM10025789_25940 [Tessaracoccus lubricantis]|uniref:Antitoxin n=1 Tax=Tessaracoccus lubricantis TaxID=545543 RepID=A0ABP9FJY7_9ACTN